MLDKQLTNNQLSEIQQDIIDWLNMLQQRPYGARQIDFTKICNVTRQAVSLWMKTGRVHDKHILKLANHFDVHPPESLHLHKYEEFQGDPLFYDWNETCQKIIIMLIEDNGKKDRETHLKLKKLLNTYIELNQSHN